MCRRANISIAIAENIRVMGPVIFRNRYMDQCMEVKTMNNKLSGKHNFASLLKFSLPTMIITMITAWPIHTENHWFPSGSQCISGYSGIGWKRSSASAVSITTV